MPTSYGANAEITGSLSVDGDIDLGSGDDDVNIDENTLFIDADQDRVGIGTTSPTHTLHVDGDVLVDGKFILAQDRYDGTSSGAMSLDKPLSTLSNTNGNISLTLANGSHNGQIKRVLVTGYDGGNSISLSIATASWTGGSGTLSFNSIGSTATLVWAPLGGSTAWWVLSAFNVSYS